MLDKIAGFHLEPTNKCTLKCPRCARTKFIDQFGMSHWQNTDLNLSDVQNFLDIDLSGKNFNLCGNYGDPIYYDDLFDLVSWIKSKSASVIISTNGSYRTDVWWRTLSELLDQHDTVIFAVDGIPDNFTQYRINADWKSIETGMSILARTPIRTQWAYIPFAYNEHDIDQARVLSEYMGINEFIIKSSDRWDGPDDALRPDSNFGIKSTHKVSWKAPPTVTVDPECKNKHQSHYISANGFYMPCCYVGDHRFYYQTEFYKNRNAYDISKTTLTRVLESLKDFYDNLESDKHKYCTFNCPKI
jgi:ribosomal protein L32